MTARQALPELPDALLNLRFGYDAAMMRAYGAACAKEARAAALEEAAKVCEDAEEAHRMFKNYQAALVLDTAAVDIRALIDKEAAP